MTDDARGLPDEGQPETEADIAELAELADQINRRLQSGDLETWGDWPMRQMKALLPWCAGAAPVLLSLSLFFIAGCSDNFSGGGTGALQDVLDESEITAIKKSSKSHRDLMKNIRTKILEKERAFIETKTSSKSARKGR